MNDLRTHCTVRKHVDILIRPSPPVLEREQRSLLLTVEPGCLRATLCNHYPAIEGGIVCRMLSIELRWEKGERRLSTGEKG